MGREMQMQMQSRSWIPHHADLYLAVVGMEDPDWMRTLLIVASSREFLVLSCGSIAVASLAVVVWRTFPFPVFVFVSQCAFVLSFLDEARM